MFLASRQVMYQRMNQVWFHRIRLAASPRGYLRINLLRFHRMYHRQCLPGFQLHNQQPYPHQIRPVHQLWFLYLNPLVFQHQFLRRRHHGYQPLCPLQFRLGFQRRCHRKYLALIQRRYQRQYPVIHLLLFPLRIHLRCHLSLPQMSQHLYLLRYQQ